jgi:hypothetical protein
MPLIIGQKGSSSCCCGDCRGFPAFDGSHRFFKYATVYDYDCCQFGPCLDSEGRDGKIKFESTGCGYGIVVEATGNYGRTLLNGECIDCKNLYPLDSIRDMIELLFNPLLRCNNYYSTAKGVVNATKATAVYNAGCCNARGDKVYWELTDEITDNTCDKMGACCGWKDYGAGSPSGKKDDKTTCRMCHECECDTAKGETWHGEGSSCEPDNPCFCNGFKAFDGSDQYFRYVELIDGDDCYLTNDRYDGGFVAEWDGGCACGVTTQNTSKRENSGKIINVYGAQARNFKVGDCVTIPSTHPIDSIHNSATFCPILKNAGCGNPEGDKIAWRLSDTISCNPLP